MDIPNVLLSITDDTSKQVTALQILIEWRKVLPHIYQEHEVQCHSIRRILIMCERIWCIYYTEHMFSWNLGQTSSTKEFSLYRNSFSGRKQAVFHCHLTGNTLSGTNFFFPSTIRPFLFILHFWFTLSTQSSKLAFLFSRLHSYVSRFC